MSETAHSLAAFAQVNVSGEAATLRQAVVETLKAKGPLTAFELGALMGKLMNTMTPRIDELQKLKIVGTMPDMERMNGDTGHMCGVYGLVQEHGARARFESDRIEIKFNEKRYHVDLDNGALYLMDEADAALALHRLIRGAREDEERAAAARAAQKAAVEQVLQ